MVAQVLDILQEEEPVSKEGWTLSETKIFPPGGSQELTENSRTLKLDITGTSITIIQSRDVVAWSTDEKINWVVTSAFEFNKPPDTLIPGQPVTINVIANVSSSGNVPSEGVRNEIRLQLTGLAETQSSTWKWENGDNLESFAFTWSPGQSTVLSKSFTFVVPEVIPDASIGLRIAEAILGLEGNIEWTYQPSQARP